MLKAVEIKMTRRGFEVTAGGRTSTFAEMEHAIGFVQQRLELARDLRDLSDRCE